MEPRERATPSATVFVAILLVAAALRSWEAVESSLWLDELHTLHHASQDSLAAVSASVGRDHHTPLFFWLVHLVGDWADGARLRWISVLVSILGLFVLRGWLRGAGASGATIVGAAWLYAVFPYQVHYGAELRPYPLLAVLSMGAFACAYARGGSTWLRFIGLLACVGLGLLTHRSMVIAVGAIFLTRLVVRSKEALPLRPLVIGGVVLSVPFVPWLVSFARSSFSGRLRQLEFVDGFQLGESLRNEIIQLPIRLIEPFIGSLGGPWSEVARFGTAAFCGAYVVAWIASRIATRRSAGVERAPRSETWRAAVVYGAIVFVATTLTSWISWDRVPLQYYVTMAWILPIVLVEPVADAARTRFGRIALGGWGAAALAMGIGLAGGKSREGVRDGVLQLASWGSELEARGERPWYSARLAQPGWVFPDRLPFQAYGTELPYVVPDEVPQPGEPEFDRPLLTFRRALPLARPKWDRIRTGRRIVRERKIDEFIWVYEWRPETEDDDAPSEPR